MTDYFKKLFETASFIPHGQSYLWEGDVLAAQLVGDGLIALACFAIPPALLYFIRRRRDLSHQHVFLFFAFFVLILGITHVLEIVTLWKPLFRLQSFFKVLTGLISLVTAFFIYRSLPLLLKMPSQARLENMNRKLRQEVTEREKAQVALREANAMLESRVQQRTSQLIKINRELEKEIEQRRNTEQELKEKNQELVRINSDLDNFVYCASADLKAPIVNIEGLVTALKEEMPQRSHHVEEILDRLDGSLVKVDRTVLDLNEVSRLQKAGLQQEKQQLEVAAVLEEVKTEINDLISATNAQINTSFASAPVVFIVAHDLKSILYNLLTNAIKFHAPDRPPVVNIETVATEKGTFIRVSDNGIGLDLPKHEHKIFAIFCRLTNTVSGTGIGLYIIKRILDNYRGKIKVKSTPGQGSTFEIFLPN